MLTIYFTFQQVVLLFTIIYLSLWSIQGGPVKQNSTNADNEKPTTKLAVQILYKAINFISKDPQKEIDDISKQAIRDVSVNERSKDYPKNSLWKTTFISNFRKKRRLRSRRKRHKIGAQINTDTTHISNTPTNKRLYKLVNRLGYYLRINFNGTIDGAQDAGDDKTILIFESHGPSIVRIKGILSGHYLTMNSQGQLLAEPSPSLFDSLFRLTYEENSWDTYASYKYYFDDKFDMLVGITKDGTVKNSWKAAPGQHATQYLTIPYV